jgi:hypothetical protein
MKAIFFVVMGNKSEKRRWFYEPFSSPRRKDTGVKKVRYGIFSHREKIQKYTVQYMEGFFGEQFLFLKF